MFGLFKWKKAKKDVENFYSEINSLMEIIYDKGLTPMEFSLKYHPDKVNITALIQTAVKRFFYQNHISGGLFLTDEYYNEYYIKRKQTERDNKINQILE